MDQTVLQAVNREVYRRFPEMKGVRPKWQARRLPKAPLVETEKTYVLTYQAPAAPPEVPFPRIIRVVINAQGQILKISLSR